MLRRSSGPDEPLPFLSAEPRPVRQDTRDSSPRRRLSPADSGASTPLSTDLTKSPWDEPERRRNRQWRGRSVWASSLLSLGVLILAIAIVASILHAFLTRQLDPKGCQMCWSRPVYIKFSDFDTEHTPFAAKYNLYLIREGGVDEDSAVKGIPLLFIPGNAGSFKQARCLEFETAQSSARQNADSALDFFAVDFNEDFSAFHGQTLLDQAAYVNDAIAYILSLYHDPRRSNRDPSLPDPTAVILVGHSMGGIVARAMLSAPNYQSNSVNTIITMSAPHARAPVSVDSDLIRVYDETNAYWRHAFSQNWASENPLHHVTLVSIAGGGLDTVVPSDFASVESLMPTSHGFTVFTSGIPGVWSGCDHIQTTWCVQLMRAIAQSLNAIVDVRRASQTKPRAARIESLKRIYLTGLEEPMRPDLRSEELLTLQAPEIRGRLVRELGSLQTYPMPIPEDRSFSVWASQKIDVLLCRKFDEQSRFVCKQVENFVQLPASTTTSNHAFDVVDPAFFLHLSPSEMAEYTHVVVQDHSESRGWLMSEFVNESTTKFRTNLGLRRLMLQGAKVELSADRALLNEIEVPALQSSLLAFKFSLESPSCGERFAPLLRQYIEQPYESKFVVNARQGNISLHGVAPYMPPPLQGSMVSRGVKLQIWADPTCNSSMTVSLNLDLAGSMGKLVMRYRLIFAAFPLLVVALVLRKQFSVYDESGIFLSFADALHLCLRSSLPLSLAILSIFALMMASPAPASIGTQKLLEMSVNATESVIGKSGHNLLLGSQDPLFWFLVPLFGLISVGACILVNYLALTLTAVLYLPYKFLVMRSWAPDRTTKPLVFAASSPRRRFITTCVLLLLVSTIIPYQFAYLDAVLVQLFTCIRASSLLRYSTTLAHHNFYNYVHSILILMLWVLPINLPVLMVWIHNLAVHWLTPFSSHHNIISIMPYLLLVETLTFGKMVPRLIRSSGRHVTSLAFVALAIGASIYGVSYAYVLHHVVNGISAWLVGIHLWGSGGVDLGSLQQMLVHGTEDETDKKQP